MDRGRRQHDGPLFLIRTFTAMKVFDFELFSLDTAHISVLERTLLLFK